MTETNMMDLVKLADVASRQSDRWLFIATLVLLLIAAAFAFRKLIEDRAEILRDAKEDRMRYQKSLETVVGEYNKLLSDYKLAIDRNTAAMQVNNRLLEQQQNRNA